MADINQSILEALQEGHAPEDIFNHLKNSENPEHRNWYEQYSANMADRSRDTNVTSPSNEPNVNTLDYISNLSPAQKALGVAGILGGSAALGAATYYGKKQIDINAAVKEQALKNQLPLSEKDLEFQRQNNISERRLQIEERRLSGELASPELSPVERIRLEREQLKLQADRQKFEYDNQVRQANILKMAKEQTGPNAATAIQAEARVQPVSTYNEPNLPVTPPAGTEAVPVQPKPIDPVQQAKIDSMAADQRRKDEAHAADQRRKDEAHANRIAKDAQRAEASTQKKQGEVKSSILPKDQAILADNAEAKARAEVVASGQPKPKTASPIGGTATPVEDVLIPPPGTPPAKVEPPEGRIASYPNPKKNKRGSDVIGQGGWHFYQGQMGPEAEAEWKKVYGETNQPYETVLKDIQSGKLKGAIVNAEGRGGSFPREAHVPNYIKGSASLKGMGSLAAAAAALGLAGSEQGQQAMEKAAKAIKDIGVSPDIFTNKAEELGSMGRAYVNAGNPNYKQELLQKLESTKDPEFKKILQDELKKLNSPFGAVPPPR
jgi:hypothetical protein